MFDYSRTSDLKSPSPDRLGQSARNQTAGESLRSTTHNFHDLASPIPNNRNARLINQNNNVSNAVPPTSSSIPRQRNFSPEDEFLGNRSHRAPLPSSKENNMNPISTLPDNQAQYNLASKPVSLNILTAITILLGVGLAGSIAWQIFLIIKVVGLEKDISNNVDRTQNLENNIVPDIVTRLSANMNLADNLQSTIIPDIQSDLTANIIKTGVLENDINQIPKVYFGSTPATTWVQYTAANGIYQDVDISQYGFQYPPIVLTSISGTGANYQTTGGSSIYSLTKDSFRLYLRWHDNTALTPAMALSWNWQLQYAVLSTDP